MVEFPLLYIIYEVHACFIDGQYLLGEGVGGTSNDGSDGFRLGDPRSNPDPALPKGSPGISLSWACSLEISFRKASCRRRSSSNLLLEDSIIRQNDVCLNINKRDALFGCAD